MIRLMRRFPVALLVSFTFILGSVSVSAVSLGGSLEDALASARADDRLRVVATFDHPLSATEAGLLDTLADRAQVLSTLPMALLEVTPAGIEQIRTMPGLVSLHQDAVLEYYLGESVSLIGAPRVWSELGLTGAGVGVAVIDSGIDATHPDLPFGEKVVQNVKIVGVSAEDDPTGSGIVQVVENVPNSDTTSGHGTHVAGTVAGTGAASNGHFTGVAPGAHLVGLGAGDTLFIFYALEGFDYAIANRDEYGIRIITNSWGSTMSAGEEYDPTHPINVASRVAYEAGMTVLFAAGNSGPGTDTLNRYALAPHVISVAAGNKDGQTLADFSSRGRYAHDQYHPTVTAPGVGIVSARANNTILPPLAVTEDSALPAEWLPYYTTMDGTSMATPHVAGVVALLYESRSDMTPDLAKRLMANTAIPMPDYEEYASGAGYVDAYGSASQALAIRNIRAYRDPRTGKDIEVYVTEETMTGSVGPAVASYNDILATSSHPFTIAGEAIFIDAKLSWDTFANDIDLFLYREDTSTDPPTWVEEGASQELQALTLSAREGVAIDYPEAGNWRADVQGWLNVPQEYTLLIERYFPIIKGSGKSK